MNQENHPGKGRFVILGILFITLMIAYIDRVNISVLIADPGFIADMNLKEQNAKQGMLMTLFLIAYALGNIILGYFGDRLGPRKAVSLSIVSGRLHYLLRELPVISLP